MARLTSHTDHLYHSEGLHRRNLPVEPHSARGLGHTGCSASLGPPTLTLVYLDEQAEVSGPGSRYGFLHASQDGL